MRIRVDSFLAFHSHAGIETSVRFHNTRTRLTSATQSILLSVFYICLLSRG